MGKNNSKRKTPPKMPQKKAPEIIPEAKKEKKPVKGIIIAAAAVILVAAIVLTAVFVVKPAIDKKNETTTANTQSTTDKDILMGEITYGEYKGVEMAQVFIDILNQAELDRKSACKEYGTAVEIGDIKISVPEFSSYYYDQYSLQRQEIEYSIEKTGTNRTGYDPDILPDAQNCLNKNYTWAEDFTRKAIEELTETYQGFNKAIEAGVVFNGEEIQGIVTQYERIETYLKFSSFDTIKELFENTYGKGYTEAMFKAREIMNSYKDAYEQQKKDALYNGYTEDDLNKELSENKGKYTVVVGRVYPIEAEYDEVEVSKINTEQEYLDFAGKNYPGQNYNAEISTRCYFSKKETVSDTFGQEVADWMFSEDRVPGEIAVITGQLYQYLVYVDVPAYLNTSRKIMAYSVDYSYLTSESDIEPAYNEAKAVYDEWVAGGAGYDEFRQICLNKVGMAEHDVRIGDYYYIFEEWIFDPARKNGDYIFLPSEVGCSMIYYIEENEDDFDWKHNARESMSDAEFISEKEKDIEDNYKEKRQDVSLRRVYKNINVVITKKLAEEKAKEKNS